MKVRMLLIGTITLCAQLLGAAEKDFALTFQGRLVDAQGAPLTARNQTVIVSLYASETSTDVLWARTYAVALDSRGIFNLMLTDQAGSPLPGSCQTLLDAVTGRPETWVGVKDGTSAVGELEPRLRLPAQPRGLRALRARQPVSGPFPVDGLLKASTATADELSASDFIEVPTVQVSGSVQANRINAESAAMTGKATVQGVMTVHGTTTVAEDVNVTGNLATPVLTAAKVSAAGSLELKKNAPVTIGGMAPDFPVGTIVMWHGSVDSVPPGWAVCDGDNQTPDLRGRFVLGMEKDKYPLFSSGGDSFVQLNSTQVPKHSHQVIVWDLGYRVVTKKGYSIVTSSDFWRQEHDVTKETEPTGEGAGHENRPPYYALFFIQRIK